MIEKIGVALEVGDEGTGPSMPDLDDALLASSDDQLVAPIQDGVEYLAVGLQVGLGGVAEHGFEVREGADGPVALVLNPEAVVQDLIDLELVEVGTFNCLSLPPAP